MSAKISWAVAIALTPFLIGSTHAQSGGSAALEAVLKDPFNDELIQAYLATLPKVGERYVLDSDILSSEEDVRTHIVVMSAGPQTPAAVNTELLLSMRNGVPGVWEATQRQLTYAVERGSFPSAEQYQDVVDRMGAAVQDWANACPKCDLSFAHATAEDEAPSHERVTFIVRYIDAGGQFIAAAFFPFTAPDERYVEIDPSFFEAGLSFDKTGVLRHELGHVIGFRHEHIRSGLPGCFVEDNEWVALTEYDSQSVMHYLCGGTGNPQLEISEKDAVGYQGVYTPP